MYNCLLLAFDECKNNFRVPLAAPGDASTPAPRCRPRPGSQAPAAGLAAEQAEAGLHHHPAAAAARPQGGLQQLQLPRPRRASALRHLHPQAPAAAARVRPQQELRAETEECRDCAGGREGEATATTEADQKMGDQEAGVQ